MRGIRHTTRNRATAAFYRTANLIFSSGRRPRNTTIFHFYFLIFHFPSFFFVAFLTTSPTATAAAWRGAGAAGSLRSPAKWASPVGRRYRRRPGISPARTKRRLQLGSTYYWLGAPPQGSNLRVLRPWPRRGAAYSAVSAVAAGGFSARKASTWACASAMTSWKPAAFSSSTIWATIVSGSEPPQEPVSSSLL